MFNRFFSRIIKRRDASHGGILVEFAFTIPLLILVLFYAFDVPKHKAIQDKIRFCSHCAVNMFQNVSRNRPNAAITKNDINQVITSMGLPYFQGLQGFFRDNKLPIGYWLQGFIYYVKGLADDKASVIWIYDLGGTVSPISSRGSGPFLRDTPNSIVRYKTNVSPSEIYKNLTISEGEVKIILEIHFFSSASCYFSNGKRIPHWENMTPSFWGMYILTPRPATTNPDGAATHFTTVIIFTPRVGLFSETPPT